MEQQKPPAYYTTQAVAKLFDDDNLRQEFMAAYNAGAEEAVKFIVEKLGMPEDMAKEVVSKQGDDLNVFVGRNVCTYLW